MQEIVARFENSEDLLVHPSYFRIFTCLAQGDIEFDGSWSHSYSYFGQLLQGELNSDYFCFEGLYEIEVLLLGARPQVAPGVERGGWPH